MENKVVLPFNITVETEKEKMRHDSFWTKEPETIEWIKSFREDDLFFDVGANIGLYSLYFASLYPKGFCIAVEPMITNVEALIGNIAVNGFRVMVERAVFSDVTRKIPLFIPDLEKGASGAQMLEPKDEHGKVIENIQRVEDISAYSFTHWVDIFHDERPDSMMKLKGRRTHIKIDVDGQEDKILEGINKESFKDIVSMLVEFNNPEMKDIWIKSLAVSGFTADNKFNKMPDHSRNRRSKEEGNIAENVVFTREVSSE